ncbi:MAG: hypothetical protein HY906_08280 [Deltaproteobacteria bacterium]|nr:hypothetical protein [Deltaproteobacteria bacterium]
MASGLRHCRLHALQGALDQLRLSGPERQLDARDEHLLGEVARPAWPEDEYEPLQAKSAQLRLPLDDEAAPARRGRLAVWLAPAATARSAVAPPGKPTQSSSKRAPREKHGAPRIDWATLLHRTFGCDVGRRVVALVTRRRTAEELLRNMGMLDVAPPRPQAPGPPQLALLQERPQQAAAPGVDVGGLVCATSDELPVSPSPFSPSAARPVPRRSRATAPPRGFEPSSFLTFPAERQRLRGALVRYAGEKTLAGLADEELDGALGLTTTIEREQVPTLAGLLLVGTEDVLRRLVPTHEVAYQVLEGTEVRVNKTTRAPLLRSLEEVFAAFEGRIVEQELQAGLFRVRVPNIEPRVLREAVINAVTHRDYGRPARCASGGTRAALP